jgi:hypothetical protein
MFVHTFCITCHQKLEDPAEDGVLTARIFICADCAPRRRFQHLLSHREGIIGLAAAMALTNPSYNFRQYKHIASSEWHEWPQLNKDISNTLCHPIRSLLRQNACSRALRNFQRKRPQRYVLVLFSMHTYWFMYRRPGYTKELNYALAGLYCLGIEGGSNQFFLGLWRASDAKPSLD